MMCRMRRIRPTMTSTHWTVPDHVRLRREDCVTVKCVVDRLLHGDKATCCVVYQLYYI